MNGETAHMIVMEIIKELPSVEKDKFFKLYKPPEKKKKTRARSQILEEYSSPKNKHYFRKLLNQVLPRKIPN